MSSNDVTIRSVPIRSTEQQVRTAVDQFFSTFSKPIYNATQFYNLYYLVEVAGVDEIGLDFTSYRDRLKADFLNYTVYATYKEAENIYHQYRIKGMKLNELKESANSGLTTAEIVNNFELDTGTDVTDAPLPTQRRWADDKITELLDILRAKTNKQEWSILNDMIRDRDRRKLFAIDRNSYKDALAEQEKELALFSTPKRFLGAMKALFSMRSLIGSDEHSETGWEDAFGGPAWQNIAKAGLKYDEMPPTAWVDMMWSVQHNNSNFIDKVEPKIPVIENLVSDVWEDCTTNSPYDMTSMKDRTDLYDVVLPTYLYAARESQFKILYETMRRIDPTVEKYKDEYANMDRVNVQAAIDMARE